LTTKGVLADVPRIAVEFAGVAFIVTGVALAGAAGHSGEDILPSIGLLGYAVLRAMPTVGRIVAAMNTIGFGRSAVEALHRELERTPPKSFPAEARRRLADVGPSLGHLELRNLTVGYTDQPVLSSASATFRAGEKVAIVGPSGAGKSTLIDSLCGLLVPWEGDVTWCGESIFADLSAWRQNVALVSQTPTLIAGTIADNVALSSLDEGIDTDRVLEAMEFAGLMTTVAELPARILSPIGYFNTGLSGGQRQRLALARANYCDPRVLILDEGTSALDTQTERDVLERVWSLYGDRTIIASSHKRSVVEICDSVYRLSDGRLEAVGAEEATREMTS
jgi:ABC-type bacteriocin/lantibiotic exporter with double-glycine peptidase domain